jgi:hypothetical protein
MTHTSLREILVLCKAIETSAGELYRTIAAQADSAEQRAFWWDLAEDERRHAAYWEGLLAWEAKGVFAEVFDDPEKTRDELEAMKIVVDRMLSQGRGFADASTAILVGLRLESLMLHPAFCIMFRALHEGIGNKSPEDDYQDHVDKFSRFIRASLPHRPEMEILGEMLSRMWQHGRELANQFTQIKTLRGLIPICANCKNIRDDDGYWNQIELYLEKEIDARFTHSICPQCARKLYPELRHDKE